MDGGNKKPFLLAESGDIPCAPQVQRLYSRATATFPTRYVLHPFLNVTEISPRPKVNPES